MSASTEKKNRLAAREAGTDKKTIAAREEAEKKAKSKRKWTIGTIVAVVLIIAVLFFSSELFYNSLTAVEIGGEKYNRGEVSYNMANQYYNFLNSDYGQYASMFGLDTSKGIAGLASQDCLMAESGTWRDYFIDMGITQMTNVKAMADEARAQGITLTEEEIAAVDEEIANTKLQASAYGYQSFKQFLALCYGDGVTEKIMRDQQLEAALASKASRAFTDAQEYTAEELEEQYKSYEGANDIYSYCYVNIAAEAAEGEDAPSELAVKEAKNKADNIAKAFGEDDGDYDSDNDKLTAAAQSVDEALSAYNQSSVAGSSLGVFADWMKNASRKPGDITVIENASGDTVNGYYVVVYGDHSDNHYNTVSVRHILIKAEADENGEYTDDAIAEAKLHAEEVFKEWEAGDKTEESFAALANQYSDDGGSNTNGGLYENIVKGEMVPAFNDFCFAGHKPGDTGIVTVKSTNYAGAHIIYFVGEGEQYSDLIAKNDLLGTAYNEWVESITAGLEAVKGAGMKFVG